MRLSGFLIGLSFTALLGVAPAVRAQASDGASTQETRLRELAREAAQEIQAGRFDAGVDLLRQALDLAGEGEPKTRVNLSLLLGTVLLKHDPAEGLQYIKRADSLCREAADEWEVCAKSRQLLILLQAVRPPEDPLAKKMQQAFEIAQSGDHEAALRPLVEALTDAQRSGYLLGETMLSAILGGILSNSDLAQSLKHLHRAEALCRGPAQALPICNKFELMLALTQGMVGIEPSADLPDLYSSLEPENPRAKTLALALDRLIHAKSDSESLAAAEEMVEIGIDAGTFGEREVQLYRQIVAMLKTTEPLSPNEALATVSELHEIAEERGNQLHPGSSKYLLGALAVADGNLEEAEALLIAAHEEAREARAIHRQGPMLRNLAGVQWKKGDRRKARQTLEQAIRIDQARELELLLESPLTVDLKQSFTTTVEQLIQYEAWSDLPQAAFVRADDLKARTLLARLGRQRPEASSPNHPLRRRVEAKRQQLRDLEHALLDAKGSTREQATAALETSRREYLALLIQQRLQASGDDADAGEPTDSLATLAELMPTMDETTLVAFYATWKELLIWVVDAERFKMVAVEISSKELKSKIRSFLTRVSRGTVSQVTREGRGAERLTQPAAAGATAEALYELLIAPIRPLLRHSRLVLIPHGILHALPFAALRDPASGRYLADDFALGNAPSVQALGRLRQQASRSRGGGALVVGNPTTSLGDLPGAELEAQRVAEVLGAQPLVRDAARESAVQRRLPTASWVHIAAHAVLQDNNPYFSRLELATDANTAGYDNTEGQDGHLEIHEILTELDLDNVELVVLSGCETAIGETTRGDEIIGLGRAFFYAGSPAVVSTLWPIDDDASAQLMTHFYRGLQAGKPVDEALQSAQNHLKSRPETRDPFFWAGYVAQGDTSRALSGPVTPSDRTPRD